MIKILHKRFALVFFLALGAVICSCQNASFINPAESVPVSDLWYTGEGMKDISGEVHDDHGGGQKPLNGQVIAAWEMPNDPSRSLYVYGIGTLSGNKDNTFTIHLRDTLPKFVLRSADTTNAIACGHIFLVDNFGIKNGDTLRQNCNWDSLNVVGSMNEMAVLFIKGSPTLLGKNFMASLQGFNLFFATRMDQNQRVKDFVPIYNSKGIEIRVDDNGSDCKKRTPYWLQ